MRLICGIMMIFVFHFSYCQKVTEGPSRGTLLIIGGAAKDSVFMPIFKELVGGEDKEIIVIPTAGSDRALDADPTYQRYQRMFQKYGFSKISVLHTRNRDEADSESFAEPLLTAAGVWIYGGRQWRLADSYLDTEVHRALRALLDRGGVIAGSSAGATIQGSYLIRGDTRTNSIIMGDHEEGFGFIKNVAIDQHLLARNRQFDMFELLPHRPELLGIGLDENTGIIVRQDVFEVVGESYVAIYDRTRWSQERDTIYQLAPDSREFYLLKPGHMYNMKTRKVVKIESKIEITSIYVLGCRVCGRMLRSDYSMA